MAAEQNNSGDEALPGADCEYRYWAFISYSHRDGAHARRLHSKLETWPVPGALVGRATPFGQVPAKLFPIFLDREEISGGHSLREVIRNALAQSRYLIAICSPHAAASKYVNEEIRIFKTLGRGPRIVCLIVNGEPGGGAGLERTANCFPFAALHAVNVDGSWSDEEVEPLAADVRPGKDGWHDAFLKITARLLAVEFNDLKRREVRRQQRKRVASGIAIAGLVLFLLAAYFAAADAGLRMPFCDSLRSYLDRHELSLFRRVQSPVEIRRAASMLEAEFSAALLGKIQEGGWVNDSPRDKPPVVSIMSHAQATAALAAALPRPSMPANQVSRLITSLEAPFKEGGPLAQNGVKLRWTGPGGSGIDESFMPLWTAIGLCEVIREPSVESDSARKQAFSIDLQYVQEVLALYHAHKDVGAWNVYPYQENPNLHSVYASTLALMALVEARRSDLPWDGSAQRRDELTEQTARWIIAQYQSDQSPHGWLNSSEEEHVNNDFDGLTVETYCALMDAANCDPAIRLPGAMYEDIRLYLVKCAARTTDFPIDVGEFRIPYRSMDGTVAPGIDSLRYLWWPWAIRCADLWLRYADAQHLPVEERVAVRRTLAHLVIEIGPQEVAAAMETYSYASSESLFCLRMSFGPE